MRTIRSRLTYANVIATLALFIAIGGASAFAASKLAKNSVGTKQIKNQAVTAAKIQNGAITGAQVKGGSTQRLECRQQLADRDADQLLHARQGANSPDGRYCANGPNRADG